MLSRHELGQVTPLTPGLVATIDLVVCAYEELSPDLNSNAI